MPQARTLLRLARMAIENAAAHRIAGHLAMHAQSLRQRLPGAQVGPQSLRPRRAGAAAAILPTLRERTVSCATS